MLAGVMIASMLSAAASNACRAAPEPEAEPAQQRSVSPGIAWVTREVKAPRVTFHTFDSIAAKTKVSYHLYTPAAYDVADNRERRFPVVYWLHGSGGGLPGIPQVARLFDEAIQAGKTPPCLVVFVNGLVDGMYVDWKDGTAPLETVIVKELVPHIDATCRTIATRDGRLLDGFSMGGYGAARLGFKFPELFRAVSIVGGGPLQPELVQTPRAGRLRAAELLNKVYGGDQAFFRSVSPRSLAEQNAATISAGSRVRIIVGDRDELFENNRLFREHLQTLKIPHSWTVLPGVGHDPMGVLAALGDENWTFYRAAFAEPASNAPGAGDPRTPDGEVRLVVAGRERRAVVVNAPVDGAKRPAVLILHGGMGSADDMRRRTGFDALARSERFMAVYAEGTEFGRGRHAWNTGFLLRRQVKDADDTAYLDSLIETLVRDRGADPSRIYMTGGSNGGMMTFVYAAARPGKLAAVAPVVASMFTFETVPTVPLPILIINGEKDDEVPMDGGLSRNAVVRAVQSAPFKPVWEVVDFWVRANKSRPQGSTVTRGTVQVTTYPAGSDGAVTEFVLDTAGGHGWPGAPARREDNSPIVAFNGAETVWSFFKQHTRSASASRTPSPASGQDATEPARP